MDEASGIRASGDDTWFDRPRIMMKESVYRVWSTIEEQVLHEKKIWGRVMGTAVPWLSINFVTST